MALYIDNFMGHESCIQYCQIPQYWINNVSIEHQTEVKYLLKEKKDRLMYFNGI